MGLHDGGITSGDCLRRIEALLEVLVCCGIDLSWEESSFIHGDKPALYRARLSSLASTLPESICYDFRVSNYQVARLAWVGQISIPLRPTPLILYVPDIWVGTSRLDAAAVRFGDYCDEKEIPRLDDGTPCLVLLSMPAQPKQVDGQVRTFSEHRISAGHCRSS